jgi:hypothetical protein
MARLRKSLVRIASAAAPVFVLGIIELGQRW